MKKIVTIVVCISCWLASAGQIEHQTRIIDTTAASEKYWSAWLNDLYEVGVIMEKDSIKINQEARQIMLDSNLRRLVYPPSYTWQSAAVLLKSMELKKGFWYLINLYNADTANRQKVIETLVPFDQLMDMQKIMVSTFYTYALLNPKLCTYKNGKPVITRPDIIEKEFSQLKEIVSYISYYRKERKG
jgi:hypothetical protein